MFDYLLQFYWPGMRRPVRRDARDTKASAASRLASRRRLAIFAVSVLIAGFAWGAAAIAAPMTLADQRNVIFERIGTAEGLSQALITTIAQDRYGFIWIGGQEGLHRYDGHAFETYYRQANDDGSLSDDSIWDVLDAADGNLWVATDDGLNLFDRSTRTFSVIPLNEVLTDDEHSSVRTLFEDGEGTLWVGTGVGLSRRRADGTFEHFHNDPADPDSIGRGAVETLFEDSRGFFWVGTQQGLYRMDRASGRFHAVSSEYIGAVGAVANGYIRGIAEDTEGAVWVGTFNGGLWVLDIDSGEVRHYSREHGLGSNRVRSLLQDQNGNMWIGTDRGLHLWHPQYGNFVQYSYDPTDPKSLGNNSVLELFQDRGGVIWVGTVNGISKWNATVDTFPHYKRDSRLEDNLASNLVTSFAEDGQTGDVWIGTFEGISRWDAGTGDFTSYLPGDTRYSDDRVMTMIVRGDELWLGTMGGGINVMRDGEIDRVYLNDPAQHDSISANAVSKLFEDSKGRLWAGTYGGGINLYLGEGRFRRYPDPGNPDGQFTDLRVGGDIVEHDGRLWISTNGGGIVVLDPDTGNTTSYTHVEGDPATLASNDVISLLKTERAIWIGSRNKGLNRFDPATGDMRHYSKAEGLASDAIFGLLEDGQGRIWISGGKGISVLDPDTNEFTTYDSTHGLQNDDFTGGANLALSNGIFLFGGGNGFNAFEPLKIQRNAHAPEVRITDFLIFNESVPLDRPVYAMDMVEIDYSDSVIGFEFAALDYTAPLKNRYEYMLEGFDRSWVQADDTQRVTYTNLDAGRYTFRVRGSNNDGVWSEGEASIGIVVNPPLWATWWAYLGYLVFGVLVLYRTQKANEARLRREAEKRYSERLQLYIESLEEATDCVLIADANKNLMYSNNAIKAILDLTPPEAVGRSILSLLFSDPTDAQLARQGLEADGRWHGEVSSKRGVQSITTEVTIAAVRDDAENETAYVSIARDITDRKRTQAELENHRRNLEFLVAERTKALEHEIAENKAVQRELANSLQEKELLLKEVHHRVKNNMQVISSLLNIQAETIEDPRFTSLLGESQQRIKSMSLIHENLYQSENLLEIDFEDYINMLANSLCRFYTIPGVSLNLDIQVDDVNLDIETAVPCGLIINELISNSLKHAFKGREGCGTISVHFRNAGCRYVLSISDDGVGLPAGFEPDASSSMGMEIVSILTQQLDGRLHIDGAEGACFEISFPRKEKANV